MGRFTGKTCRLSTMLVLTAGFFLVEIIVGYVTNSIALIADSFHMLSDVVALIVGFASVRHISCNLHMAGHWYIIYHKQFLEISKWPSKRNTYGWVRAEILGALVNAVFLLALCFSILVEALKRLVTMEMVDNPKLLLVVGVAGLVVNLIGLLLFGCHGHSHGGHGHSHGGGHGHSHGGGHSEGHGHKQEHNREEAYLGVGNGSLERAVENEALVQSEKVSPATPSGDGEIFVSHQPDITIEIKKPQLVSSQQLNMRGVFLHVLGDALGSVVVIISALVIWFAEGSWKYYIDPAMSIFMVIIILSTAIPLLKESAFILLQTVPSHVNVENIIKELMQMKGIFGVHECHIWQLAGNRIVASAHIRCRDIQEYMSLAAQIKDLFHKAGIHSTTIQPEFVDPGVGPECVLQCNAAGETCKADTCCGGAQKLISELMDHPDSAVQPGNTNSSAGYKPCTFSSLKSLDLKFSPDGDEVVFEMSDMISPGARGEHGDSRTSQAVREEKLKSK